MPLWHKETLASAAKRPRLVGGSRSRSRSRGRGVICQAISLSTTPRNAKDSALPESARCGTSLSLSRTLPFKRLSGSDGTSSMTSVHSRHATSSQRLSTFRIRGARDVVPDNYSNCRSGATIRIKETLPRYRGPGSASETNDGI